MGDVYVVPPDGEADYFVEKETQSLWIFLASEYAEQLCLVPGQNLVKRVHKGSLQKLLPTCRVATRSSDQLAVTNIG